MNKWNLNEQEGLVFDQISLLLAALPEQSQYSVLGKTAHMMDREVVRIGATRAAAAVAGSTARALSEAGALKKAERRSASKSKGKAFAYPPAFLARGGQAKLDLQKTLRERVQSDPSDQNRAALRTVSESLRDSFRAFKEGNDTSDE